MLKSWSQKNLKEGDGQDASSAGRANRDVTRIEEALSDKLGTPVTVKANAKGKGQLIMAFHGWDDFAGLMEKIGLKDSLPD